MRHLLPLIASFMVVLTFWSGTVAHAAEAVGPAMIEASIHFEGDRDQVPADEHRPAPHHHGTCDAHNIGIAAGPAPAAAALAGETSAQAAPAMGLPSGGPDTALRPPIA